MRVYTDNLSDIQIKTCPLCAWDKAETVILTDGAGRNTTIGGVSIGKTKNGAKVRTSDCDALDNQCDYRNEKLLIKYDVEGAEYDRFSLP